MQKSYQIIFLLGAMIFTIRIGTSAAGENNIPNSKWNWNKITIDIIKMLSIRYRKMTY